MNDPVTDQPLFLPGDPLAALVILAGYTVAGWAGLSLIYLTVSLGRALGELSREPLEVDVFDTTNLLPFGNIALAGALAPVGIIGILLFGLGSPESWLSWSVLLLAAVREHRRTAVPVARDPPPDVGREGGGPGRYQRQARRCLRPRESHQRRHVGRSPC